MRTNRLEAFSDGVLAIIITIMVLEFEVPHGTMLADLKPLFPVALSYVLSFVYVGIYWSNHHHMLAVTERVVGSILWANLHLLFWLSLVPFVTAWMGENHFAAVPTAIYGIVLLFCAIAYTILQRTILGVQGPGSTLESALASDWKGKLSPVIYIVAIPASLFHPWIGGLLYAGVALIWIVPDKRIERAVSRRQGVLPPA